MSKKRQKKKVNHDDTTGNHRRHPVVVQLIGNLGGRSITRQQNYPPYKNGQSYPGR